MRPTSRDHLRITADGFLPDELRRRLAEEVTEASHSAICALQGDQRVQVVVKNTWWSLQQNVASGGWVNVLNVVFASNAPQVAMGGFTLLEEASLVGYNTLFLQGYGECLLAERFAEVADLVTLRFAFSLDSANRSGLTHPYYLTVQEALRIGAIADGSPIAIYAKKYGLDRVEILGSGVVGPSTEVIAVLESIWDQLRPETVLDLFGGSGALAEVCRQLGAHTVDSIDSAPPRHGASIDLLSPTLSEQIDEVDLAIVDQFVEHTALANKTLLRHLTAKARSIIWNMGFAIHKEDFEELLNAPHFDDFDQRLFEVNDTIVALMSRRPGAATR